jgi:Rieske 2Fe-2S family protein
VFVTLGERDSTPELEEWLGETPPWLDELRELPHLARGRRRVYEVNADWKLCAQNFQESHHFPRIHRELEQLTPTEHANTWLPKSGPWLGGTMAIADGAETVSRGGSRRDRPFLVPPVRRRTVHDAMLFPSLLTSLQPDYLLTYRLTPLAPGRTRIDADVYFHPAALVPGFDADDVYTFWDRVNEEDRAICEDQQANARSRAFEPAGYLDVEEGVEAFDRMVARAHLAGRR